MGSAFKLEGWLNGSVGVLWLGISIDDGRLVYLGNE